MKCSGCYIETTGDYCMRCRIKLFGKAKVPKILTFDTPQASNLEFFQSHSVRMSISGFQLKYALNLENGKLNLCEHNGEYILKPIPVSKQLLHLHDVPANEHISMQLADRIFDIPTASNGIIYFRSGESAYITKRFDKNEYGEKYLMEDFAQLSQKLPEKSAESYKYEGTYEEIGALIKKYVTAPIPSLEGFFKLVLFNYIICNGDAHLKNFSLLRSATGEYFLSPAYDLMSTILHSPTESDTALQLYEGDLESDFYSSYGYYGKPNFMELADKLGIIEKRAMRIFQTCASRKNEVLSFLEQSILSQEGKKIYASNMIDRIGRLSQ